MREHMHCENLGSAPRGEPATTAHGHRSASEHSQATAVVARSMLAITGVLLTFVHAKPAFGAFDYRLSATGSVTYTDNLNSAADDVPEDSNFATRQSGFLFALNPGATVSLLEPRGQLTLGYARPMTYATSDAVAPSTTDALVGSGNYEPTEVDNVGLSAAITRSSMTSLLFNGQNPAAVTGLNNAGTQEVLRGQVNEFWTREWSETVSSQQTSSYGTQLDLEGEGLPSTRILSHNLTLRLDHRFGAFTLGVTETSTELDSTWAHLVTGLLGWSRELDALTTLALQAGVSKSLNDTPPQLVGSATISQARDFTTWSLTVARNQNADLQTGRIFSTESAIATFATAPFETTQLSFVAGGGGSRFGAEGATAYAAQAFASINYTHQYFVSSLNYTFLHQVSEGDQASAIPSLTRNAITLTIGGVFPAETEQ